MTGSPKNSGGSADSGGDRPVSVTDGAANEAGWVCLGVIGRPHGVRGQVRVKPFTDDPRSVAAYGPVTDRAGRDFSLSVTGVAKGLATVRIEGVDDRQVAEALRGVRLWVARDALPPPAPEEYYHADLIGLFAVSVSGEPLGRVCGVFDFGAGDVLDIACPGGTVVAVPFTRECVPEVDIAGRRVVIDPPDGLFGSTKDAGKADGQPGEESEGGAPDGT